MNCRPSSLGLARVNCRPSPSSAEVVNRDGLTTSANSRQGRQFEHTPSSPSQPPQTLDRDDSSSTPSYPRSLSEQLVANLRNLLSTRTAVRAPPVVSTACNSNQNDLPCTGTHSRTARPRDHNERRNPTALIEG